ncbi:MAG TPA: urea ABC transporter permease subunit UrtB [Xanthobacteraceae bacterium]|nr:urea ABC transporter permease subunit UrtB [Xanthobacteraceae bacterium]
MPKQLTGSIVVLFVGWLLTQPAFAGPLEHALARFQADNYGETEAAVGELAASGDARAAAVIDALADGRLFVAGEPPALIVRDPGGKTLDAATGAALATDPASLRPVRISNRVRRAIDAARGALTLFSTDPDRRRAAADAVFKARDANALSNVEKALARESDAAAKRALEQARAAILLVKTDVPSAERRAAVAAVAARGDQDALALLRSLPVDAPADLKEAAASAAASIERMLAIWEGAQNVWYGVSLGSVLLLAAIGLAITFGVMGIINMAHGEMVMLGAYTTFVVQEWIRANDPGLFDWSLAFALPLAFAVAGGAGILVERGIIRFLYGRPLETLLATWGLSLILQQAVRTAFGPTNREVGAPSWMSGSLRLGQLAITYNRLWIVVFALAVFLALLFVLRFTRFGLEMRAVTQNRAMAGSMGIRTARVDALTFGLGSGIAGMAGVALSQIDNVSPNLGQGYIIDSFLVVVFGGVGNLFGTLIGALTLGIANKLLEPYAGAVLGKIVLLVLIILFIQKRPRGLFALKGRTVEV